MAGVQRDLRWTAAACAQIKRRARQRDYDSIAIEALHDAALSRYGRCFKKGRRDAFHIPRQWITELPDSLRETHEHVLDLRDRHIAHSVNDWEVNLPVVRLVAGELGATVLGDVSVRQVRVLMLGAEEVDRFWHLAKTLADRVVESMEAAKADLLQEARRIPIEKLQRRLRVGYPVRLGRGVIRGRR